MPEARGRQSAVDMQPLDRWLRDAKNLGNFSPADDEIIFRRAHLVSPPCLDSWATISKKKEQARKTILEFQARRFAV